VPASASAVRFMPLDAAGPRLKVSSAKARNRLECGSGVRDADRPPVLLLHGTSVNSRINWSWNYEPALTRLGIGWCALDSPDNAEADIQLSGEYIVRSLRWMHRVSRQRVSMIGHSQGGMVGRWPLRWWPDTRKIVDDYIGFAGTNHGSSAFECDSSCTAAGWQQTDTSHFIRALNSGAETFKGVSYTNIYTHRDETVQPAEDDTGSSSLHTGKGRITNVAVQDICPLDVNEHLLIGTIDPAAYALAIDALDHDGPADESRIPATVCAEPTLPGLQPVGGAANGLEGLLLVSGAGPDFETFDKEPKLACYTTTRCRRPRV
jgi:hypothetical protein